MGSLAPPPRHMKLAAILVAAALAVAPPKPPKEGADNPIGFRDPQAFAEFQAAMTAWNAEDFETARRLLDSAYAIEAKPKLHYSLGQLARKLGDCVGAIQHFEAFLETDPPQQSAADARVNIERCVTELAGVQARPAPTYEPKVGPQPPPVQAEPAPVAPEPEPPRKPDKVGIALTSVGIGLAIVGAGVFGSSFSAHEQAQSRRPIGEFERGLRSAKIQYWTGASIGAVGAGLLIAGTFKLVVGALRQHESRKGKKH